MKYLFIREADGAEFPFLFCAPFTHMEMALMLQGHRHGRIIVSAGFVEWFADDSPRMTGEIVGQTPAAQQRGTGKAPRVYPRCFGRSESLNLDSRPALDSAHLAAFYSATLSSAKALYSTAA